MSCPHTDCAKPLKDIIYHHGIVFYPHCQKSLVVNPFTADLEKMTFWAFIPYFIKTQYKLYAVVTIIFAVFVAIIEVIDNFDKINFGQAFWIGLSVWAFLLLGLAIFYLEKHLKNYRYNKLKNKLLLKGVDYYDDVKEDIKISVASEELKSTFDGFGFYCPNCHSQRFHQHNDEFICQNCHHRLMINKQLKKIEFYRLVIHYILMFMIIRYLDNGFYVIMALIPLLFLVNLIFHYYWFKTPKCNIQSP